MAYAAEDDKQKQDQGPASAVDNPMGAAPLAGAGGGPASGGGAGSAPASTARGTGGTGWANIQSYLNANQGSGNKSAEILGQAAGGALGAEKQKLGEASGGALSKARGEVTGNAIGADAASKLVGQMGSQYAYNGAPQSAGYTQAQQQLNKGVSGQYGGPKAGDFTYGMGAEAQRVGQLGNDQSFQGYLQDQYGKATGAPIGSGAMALQTQLDVNNPALQAARKSALGQYAGLEGDVKKSLTDTNAGLGQAQTDYAKNQADLKNYLQGQAATSQQIFGASQGGNYNAEADKFNAIQDALGQSDRLRPQNVAAQTGAKPEYGSVRPPAPTATPAGLGVTSISKPGSVRPSQPIPDDEVYGTNKYNFRTATEAPSATTAGLGVAKAPIGKLGSVRPSTPAATDDVHGKLSSFSGKKRG